MHRWLNRSDKTAQTFQSAVDELLLSSEVKLDKVQPDCSQSVKFRLLSVYAKHAHVPGFSQLEPRD